MSALDVEIGRVCAAVLRYQASMDAVREAVEGNDGPQSAHEHSAEWNRVAEQLSRTSAWFCVLLRKRGTEADLKLANAVEISAWP